MTRQRPILKVISFIIAVTFLCSNSVLSSELSTTSYQLSTNKLAVESLVGELEAVAAAEYVNRAVLGALLDRSPDTFEADRELQEALDGLDTEPFSYGVLRSRENPEERAFYIFYFNRITGHIIAHRYSEEGKAPDPLYNKILRGYVKQSEPKKVNGYDFIHEVILVPPQLRSYILSLKFPGEHPRGLAKSLSYPNDPVTDEEKAKVEELIAGYESSGEIRAVEDTWMGVAWAWHLEEEHLGLIDKIKFVYVPDIVITRRDGKKRVFPAYTKKIDKPIPGGPEWIVYVSRRFTSEVYAYDVLDPVGLLISHELDEIAGRSCEQAEQKELERRGITIHGQEMSLLDAFIYFVYAHELGTETAPWWDDLYSYISSWIAWNKLRLVIGNANVAELERADDYITSFLYPGFARLKELNLDTSRGPANLWEYTLAVCKSLQHFQRGEKVHFPEIGNSNFQRLQGLAGCIFGDQNLRELFWLAAIFHQVGKAKDHRFGNYYLEGKVIVRDLLRDYYEKMGHVPMAERERLITLGSELVCRFGDMRAVHIGDRTPEVLLKIKDIPGLSSGDKELLLKFINIFTVLYAQNRAAPATLGDDLVNDIFDIAEDIGSTERHVTETDWFSDRLDIWCGSKKNKALIWSAIFDIIPEEERGAFQDFLKRINLFNAFRIIREIVRQMEGASDKQFYARALVKMLYFLMKLNEFSGGKEWIIFGRDTVAEDMINRFGYVEVSQIDEVLETEKEDICSGFREGRKVILFGIPFFTDRNRLIVELYRYGRGVEHGINKMNRLLSEAVRDPQRPLDGRYYDLLTIVTDEFSAPEMVDLVKRAKREGYIPRKAKVVVVLQPYKKIEGNWSAIVNLMHEERLRVDENLAEDVQLIDERSPAQGVQLGEYIKGRNIAVVLSAGEAKRNYPPAHHGYRDKGKMSSLNGNPYLLQTFRQIMYNFDPDRKGMFITTNDGIKCISQEVVTGRQGFQIIGAAKPAQVGPDKRYNSKELGELGCMVVDLIGYIGKFVEKPDEKKWQTKLVDRDGNPILFVPTNWADYYLRPDFLAAVAEIYGSLRDENGQLLYLKYGLDTSGDLSEPSTLGLEEYQKAKKEKAGWDVKDAEKIWRAARQIKERFHIGFVDAGRDAYFKDTGTNFTFKDLARELLRNKKLREFFGMAENKYRIIDGNLIGPNVRLGKNVVLGRGSNVIVGNVTIERGVIGDNCLIMDSVIREINIPNGTMVYGVYRPQGKLSLAHSDMIITEVFLNRDRIDDTRQRSAGLDVIRFPNGKEAVRVPIIMPLDAKAGDKVYQYKIMADGIETVVYVRNEEIVGGDRRDWIKTKNVKLDKDKNKEELICIRKDDEGNEVRVVLGVVVNPEEDIKGGSVWGFHVWPRDPGRIGHIRVGERASARGKLSFDEISSFTDKEAISVFKEILANPSQVLDIPDAELKYPVPAVREAVIEEPVKVKGEAKVSPVVKRPEITVGITEAEAKEVLDFIADQLKILKVYMESEVTEMEQETIFDLLLDQTCVSPAEFERALSSGRCMGVLLHISDSSFLDRWYLEWLRSNNKIDIEEEGLVSISRVIDKARVYRNAVMEEDRSWLGRKFSEFQGKNLVYISPETKILGGLKSLLSGGLGVLAGDMVIGFGDIGMNTIEVLPLYKKALIQRVDHQGRQELREVTVDYSKMPIKDTGVIVDVPVEGRVVKVRVYEVREGRVHLYLLDTDIPENSKEDRDIFSVYYKGEIGSRERLLQYVVLGKGTIAVLKAMKIPLHILHLNEPHAVIAAYELNKMRDNALFADTKVVFTTHTPVDAGLPKFGLEMASLIDTDTARVRNVFAYGNMLDLGRAALRLCDLANAVSQEHRDVTVRRWAQEYKDIMLGVTNGVDAEFWQDSRLQEPGWEGMNDEGLFNLKRQDREELLAEVERRTGVSMDKDALTIVIARRITGYKNTTMILEDLDRLKGIIGVSGRPVQVIFAGVSHVRDEGGKGTIRWLNEISRTADFKGKIVFVPNYNLHFGRLAVRGADIVISCPLPGEEAGPTSYMKALKNGGVVISTKGGAPIEQIRALPLDFDPGTYNESNFNFNGIFIEPYASESLYQCVSKLQEIYYEHRHIWAHLMRNAIRTEVDIRDVAMEYVRRAYYAGWYKDAFSGVRMGEMDPGPGELKPVTAGVDGAVEVSVEVNLGVLKPDRVEVEIWYGLPSEPEGWQAIGMNMDEVLNAEGGTYRYKGSIPIPADIRGSQILMQFTSRVRLKGIDLGGFTKWQSKPHDNGIIFIRKPATVPAGPIARKVRGEEETIALWQADLKEDGEIDESRIVVLNSSHPKIGQIDLGKYKKARDMLVKRYGTGIFGGISGIRFVDNLKVSEADDIAPYAVIDEIDGERYILVDVDFFLEESGARYLILEHELKHSILDLLEDNKVLKELSAIYMSLKEAIQGGIVSPRNLGELGLEHLFWELLDKLEGLEKDKITDEIIISYAIEHMRQMPYYRGLFDRLGLDESKWLKAVRIAEEKTEAVIDIYNQLAGAEDVTEGIEVRIKPKDIVSSVRRTEGAVLRRIKTFNGKIRIAGLDSLPKAIQRAVDVLREIIDSTDEIRNETVKAIEAQDKKPKKYIWLDKEKESGLDEGIRTEWEKIKEELVRNGFTFVYEKPEGINKKDIIRLVDISDLPDLERKRDTLYLSMPYTRVSLYLAAQVVLAGGDVGRLGDSMAVRLITELYEQLLGREVTDSDLTKLFTQPWFILPEIENVIENLNRLTEAAVLFDVAA